MYFEQFYLGCLAHASYMVASEGEAIVVDPQRDVDIYLEAAAKHGVTIRHIFETHLHADFVSGHKELSAVTGAKIYVGACAGATFPHVGVNDGFQVKVGKILLRVMETPGHTPESICLTITREEESPNPWAVLTGDTLFVGDVGRPDLSETHTTEELAGMLFDSLHGKLLQLPNEVLVYPAHGAGSLCGRNMRAEKSSTIGTERLTNYALQISSRPEFIRQMTSNLPARPEYFVREVEINRAGAGALSDLPKLNPISPFELKALLDREMFALDVRSSSQFCSGHVPGSISIPLSGQFASWAATVLGFTSWPVLIAESAEQLAEARMRLARVGIEDVRGFLQGGVEGWKEAGFPLADLRQISVQTLNELLAKGEVRVLDVRREVEWEAGHIKEAVWSPLDKFKFSMPEINRSELFAVVCKGGYRSAIACSLLKRAGFQNVVNVTGGFDAWLAAKLPVETAQAIEA